MTLKHELKHEVLKGSMEKLRVCLDKKQSQSYEIFIGYDIFSRISGMMTKRLIATRYIIITDDNISILYGEALLANLTSIGIRADLIVFPHGERSKSIQVVLDLTGKLLDLGVDRNSALIALGGGVVGDVTGFVASIYMRGLPYLQIPTSLIGQVDSSIGGKTAVNLPQSKNLLGTFYQPSAVFIDIKYLDTLSLSEYRNGLVELVKYGIIDSETFFQQLEGGLNLILARDRTFMETIIQTACRIKKDIVEMDEKKKSNAVS
jgi:3-dehydroquinate synthase